MESQQIHTLESIAPELKAHIFNYLSISDLRNCRLVSTQFNQSVQDFLSSVDPNKVTQEFEIPYSSNINAEWVVNEQLLSQRLQVLRDSSHPNALFNAITLTDLNIFQVIAVHNFLIEFGECIKKVECVEVDMNSVALLLNTLCPNLRVLDICCWECEDEQLLVINVHKQITLLRMTWSYMADPSPVILKMVRAFPNLAFLFLELKTPSPDIINDISNKNGLCNLILEILQNEPWEFENHFSPIPSLKCLNIQAKNMSIRRLKFATNFPKLLKTNLTWKEPGPQVDLDPNLPGPCISLKDLEASYSFKPGVMDTLVQTFTNVQDFNCGLGTLTGQQFKETMLHISTLQNLSSLQINYVAREFNSQDYHNSFSRLATCTRLQYLYVRNTDENRRRFYRRAIDEVNQIGSLLRITLEHFWVPHVDRVRFGIPFGFVTPEQPH